MKIAVKDANVLIDLVEGDLLGLWFRLGIETHVPDLVLAEIQNPNQSLVVNAMVEAGNLQVGTFEPGELARIQSYRAQFRVSLADAAAIFLAERLNATLLSGDKLVRSSGRALDLEIRGLLWVIDQLVHSEHLAPREAAIRLTRVREAGARLPEAECQERLERWGKSETRHSRS